MDVSDKIAQNPGLNTYGGRINLAMEEDGCGGLDDDIAGDGSARMVEDDNERGRVEPVGGNGAEMGNLEEKLSAFLQPRHRTRTYQYVEADIYQTPYSP